MQIDSLERGQILTDEVFLVADAKLLIDRRGQNYYALILNHEGGRQLEAKVWSDSITDKIEVGNGLEVLARVDEYMGNFQLNIQQYRVLAPEEFDVSRYVRSTTIDVDAAFEKMFNWNREEFSNPFFKALMGQFYGNDAFRREFTTSPAASFHHHNYSGGLVEHTQEVWDLAEGLSTLYKEHLDRELLLCGAALHDIGKVKSYELTAGVSQRSDVGRLLDHVFISSSMVSNLWDRAVKPQAGGQDAQKAATYKNMLLHIILSHHGCREWGSPVLPQTPEAVLIHYCDQISASMRSCFDAIDIKREGESWTDRVYIMDEARNLFVPPE